LNIQTLFALGMKRDVCQLIEPDHTLAINVGAGHQQIAPNVQNLDYPAWDARSGVLPYGSGTVTSIYAFHFLEHLTGAEAIAMLREFQRVLVVGGTVQIVVPHYKSAMAFHDLDHKAFFTEDTWRTLFSTPYYDKNRELPWKFDVHVNLLIGVVERNLALMTQLVKTA